MCTHANTKIVGSLQYANLGRECTGNRGGLWARARRIRVNPHVHHYAAGTDLLNLKASCIRLRFPESYREREKDKHEGAHARANTTLSLSLFLSVSQSHTHKHAVSAHAAPGLAPDAPARSKRSACSKALRACVPSCPASEKSRPSLSFIFTLSGMEEAGRHCFGVLREAVSSSAAALTELGLGIREYLSSGAAALAGLGVDKAGYMPPKVGSYDF